ncbi:hypothetical protein HID58_013637 [Brassica napus]|uniref:Uncharacterized protein n=1 Tax=Brassica napus TaxID=3708 RepID=A0ABQ8E773_BRANA|nr:hypothetical protein HID58_013637 [Brassica napus]
MTEPISRIKSVLCSTSSISLACNNFHFSSILFFVSTVTMLHFCFTNCSLTPKPAIDPTRNESSNQFRSHNFFFFFFTKLLRTRIRFESQSPNTRGQFQTVNIMSFSQGLSTVLGFPHILPLQRPNLIHELDLTSLEANRLAGEFVKPIHVLRPHLPRSTASETTTVFFASSAILARFALTEVVSIGRFFTALGLVTAIGFSDLDLFADGWDGDWIHEMVRGRIVGDLFFFIVSGQGLDLIVVG